MTAAYSSTVAAGLSWPLSAARYRRKAYQKVLPDEQPTPGGKDSGIIARVEGWNNTLRGAPSAFCQQDLVVLEVRPDA